MADLDPDLDVRVAGAGGERVGRARRLAVAVVRDGGLTEIAPGSETVLVLGPGASRGRSRG